MKSELKALAKESFLEELERLRLNSTNILANNGVDNKVITQELYQLQSVVEEMRRENHNHTQTNNHSMRLDWSSPMTRDQQHHAFPTINPSYLDNEPATSRGDDNKVFVLSCAPIQGFNKIMKNEGNSFDAPMSLLDQANRFAEMQSLFQLPSHIADDDSQVLRSASQTEKYSPEWETQKQMKVVKQKKLESSIHSHVDRVEKGRNPIRRFPLDIKPSGPFASPRAKAHRKIESHAMDTPGRFDPNNTSTTINNNNNTANYNNTMSLTTSNQPPGSPPPASRPTDLPGFATPASESNENYNSTATKTLNFTAAIESAVAGLTNTTTTTTGDNNNTTTTLTATVTKPVVPVLTADEFKEKTDK